MNSSRKVDVVFLHFTQCSKNGKKKNMFIFFVKAQMFHRLANENYCKKNFKLQIINKIMAVWNDGLSKILNIFEVCNESI